MKKRYSDKIFRLAEIYAFLDSGGKPWKHHGDIIIFPMSARFEEYFLYAPGDDEKKGAYKDKFEELAKKRGERGTNSRESGNYNTLRVSVLHKRRSIF